MRLPSMGRMSAAFSRSLMTAALLLAPLLLPPPRRPSVENTLARKLGSGKEKALAARVGLSELGASVVGVAGVAFSPNTPASRPPSPPEGGHHEPWRVLDDEPAPVDDFLSPPFLGEVREEIDTDHN